MQERRSLLAGGATAQQMQVWYQQNLARFQAQQQSAVAFAGPQALKSSSQAITLRIPADASPALTNYLNSQATLAAASALATGTTRAVVSGSLISQTLNQAALQETSTRMLQAQRAQAISNGLDQRLKTVPAVIVIPAGTSAPMAAFLTARNQMRRSLIQLENQYASATPAVRQAALEAWYKQNAPQLAQLKQQTQNLFQAPAAAQN
jgi:hypothetical protein